MSFKSYLAVLQLLGHDICADFPPFDDVASVFRVPAHGPCAGAFVEAIVDLLGREGEASESAE